MYQTPAIIINDFTKLNTQGKQIRMELNPEQCKIRERYEPENLQMQMNLKNIKN